MTPDAVAYNALGALKRGGERLRGGGAATVPPPCMG